MVDDWSLSRQVLFLTSVDLSFCFSLISFSDACTISFCRFLCYALLLLRWDNQNLNTYDLSKAIKYLSFKTGQIRHIGRKRGCLRYSINILKYKFWSLINTRNIWKYLTLDQQKNFLDGSLQVRFLNLGILTMTNSTRPLLALNILFPKQVPCLLCSSNHLITVNQCWCSLQPRGIIKNSSTDQLHTLDFWIRRRRQGDDRSLPSSAKCDAGGTIPWLLS